MPASPFLWIGASIYVPPAVKLFYRFGYNIDIISPSCSIDNNDMDSFYARNVVEYDGLDSVDMSKYDMLYYNGMDEDAGIKSPDKYGSLFRN